MAKAFAASFEGKEREAVARTFTTAIIATYCNNIQEGASHSFLLPTFDSQDFTSSSFSVSSTGGNLTGGSDAVAVTNSVYSYSVPAGGYAANGNVLAYTDSVMGTWNFTYDQLNRLVSAAASPSTSLGTNFCWAYDSFGNRTQQVTSNAVFATESSSCSTTGAIYQNTVATYNNAQNQISSTNAGGTVVSPTYDAAGNITYDGTNAYLYDGEGRICAVESAPYSGGTVITGYIYDAGGNRVAKGTLASFSCGAAFTETAGYVVAGGEQLTEFTIGSGNAPVWKHTNVYAGGKLIGTYDGNGLHFHIDDPLGTRRAQTNAAGALEVTY